MKVRIRYDATDVGKFHLLAYIVGQSETVFGKPVTVADIAPTIGASKPTAQKFLNRMCALGYLVCEVKAYRRNAVKYEYRLTQSAYNKFQDGKFDDNYNWYKSILFQYRMNGKSGKISI